MRRDDPGSMNSNTNFYLSLYDYFTPKPAQVILFSNQLMLLMIHDWENIDKNEDTNLKKNQGAFTLAFVPWTAKFSRAHTMAFRVHNGMLHHYTSLLDTASFQFESHWWALPEAET